MLREIETSISSNGDAGGGRLTVGMGGKAEMEVRERASSEE